MTKDDFLICLNGVLNFVQCSPIKEQDCIYCTVLEKMHDALPVNGENRYNPAPHSVVPGDAARIGDLAQL